MPRLDTDLLWCDDHIVDFKWGKDPDLDDGGNRRRLDAKNLPPKPWIFLILESPHTGEFRGGVHLHGPVRGATRTRIQTYLKDILGHDEVGPAKQEKAKECHGLVLMNAIQHQCSKGENLQEDMNVLNRDHNFINHWGGKQGREDFLNRLKSYRYDKNKDFIILACTLGHRNTRKTQSLRSRVGQGMTEAGVVPDLISFHPYNWRPEKRRKPQKRDW